MLIWLDVITKLFTVCGTTLSCLHITTCSPVHLSFRYPFGGQRSTFVCQQWIHVIQNLVKLYTFINVTCNGQKCTCKQHFDCVDWCQNPISMRASSSESIGHVVLELLVSNSRVKALNVTLKLHQLQNLDVRNLAKN